MYIQGGYAVKDYSPREEVPGSNALLRLKIAECETFGCDALQKWIFQQVIPLRRPARLANVATQQAVSFPLNNFAA